MAVWGKSIVKQEKEKWAKKNKRKVLADNIKKDGKQLLLEWETRII